MLLEVTHMYMMLHTLLNANDERGKQECGSQRCKDMLSHQANSC